MLERIGMQNIIFFIKVYFCPHIVFQNLFAGYDVYNSLNKPETILWALHKANITHHVWLGEGLTNCFSPDYNRLRNLVHLRDVGIYTHGNLIWPDAVYHWTIDTTKHIRLSLELVMFLSILLYTTFLSSCVYVI